MDGQLAQRSDYEYLQQFAPPDVVEDPADQPGVGGGIQGGQPEQQPPAVLDEADQHIGSFQQKLLSVGGAFTVLGPSDEELCRLQGKWTGWDFRFTAGDTELAHVTKKWAGIGKELFTSADNYILEISDDVPSDNRLRQLILAAVMSIDMVLKE